MNLEQTTRGDLIIIGGSEDKAGERVILREVAGQAAAAGGTLVLVTTATSVPAEVAREYTSVFNALGVNDVEVLDVRAREDSHEDSAVRKLAGAAVVFFTGGDQLRITRKMEDTPVLQRIREMFFNEGLTVAGTSAGATAMSETMVFAETCGDGGRRQRTGTAPGLSLMKNVVIDSHFAARGRLSRLLNAVARRPEYLGLGIDEDTAIVVNERGVLRVIGSGSVYVVDGSGITYTGQRERVPEVQLSIFGIGLHVLNPGDLFDLKRRVPIRPDSHCDALVTTAQSLA